MTLHRRDAIKSVLAAVAASTVLAIPEATPAAASYNDLRDLLNRLDRDVIQPVGLMELSPHDLMAISAATMVWGAMPFDDALYEHHRRTSLGELHTRGIVTAEEWGAATRDAFRHLSRVDPDRLGAFSVTFVR